MWTVGNKPTLAQALGDIDELVNHCRGLNNGHKSMLAKLYSQYHLHRGYAIPGELRPLEDVKDIIHGQYKSKMTGSNNLAYVRRELRALVDLCPMCGINEPNTLDHYMNEGDYGQLACCRLNLVPVCGLCNRTKHDDPYTDFVHAFYDQYLDVDFLITTITVKNNKVGMIFSIDQNALGNTDLARRTASQFAKLGLNDRLHKAGILFVNDMIGGFVCTNDRELAASLLQKETFLKVKNGRNDWRTSIVRGLRQCAAFNMQVVNAMRDPFNLRPLNGGGS